MKKCITVFLIASALLCSCSQSPQKKAEKLVNNYLMENLHDPSSYESIEYSALDSIYNIEQNKIDALKYYEKQLIERYSDTTIISNVLRSISSNNKEAYKIYTSNLSKEKKQYIANIPTKDTVLIHQIADSIFSIFRLIDKETKSLQLNPIFYGYSIEHTYRAKNKLGAKVLDTDIFYLDSTLTKVIDYKSK